MAHFGFTPGRRWPLLLARLVVATLLAAPDSPAVAQPMCVGDCDSSGDVTVNELVTMVNIALGSALVSACITGDPSHDNEITIDEILAAVNNTLNRCPAVLSLTPEGQLWAEKIIDHAGKVARGEPVTEPPFVDRDLAGEIALAASVVEKIVANSDNFTVVTADPDYVALLAFIDQRVALGEAVTLEDLSSFYGTLNRRESTYPLRLGGAAAGGCDDQGNLLSRVLGLVDFLHPHASIKERGTDGKRVVGTPTHPEQPADIDFVNGVQTPFVNGVADAFHLGKALDRDVNHIHNEAVLLPGKIGIVFDAAQALSQKFKLPPGPAEQEVKAQILAHAEAGIPYILICHSQGATVCARGAQLALQGATQSLRTKITQSTAVITLGGFAEASDFPPDVLVSMIEREHDSIPRLARGIPDPNPFNLLALAHALLDLPFVNKEHALTTAYVPAPCPGGGSCHGDTCSGACFEGKPLEGKPCRTGNREELKTREALFEGILLTRLGKGPGCCEGDFNGFTGCIPSTTRDFCLSIGGNSNPRFFEGYTCEAESPFKARCVPAPRTPGPKGCCELPVGPICLGQDSGDCKLLLGKFFADGRCDSRETGRCVAALSGLWTFQATGTLNLATERCDTAEAGQCKCTTPPGTTLPTCKFSQPCVVSFNLDDVHQDGQTVSRHESISSTRYDITGTIEPTGRPGVLDDLVVFTYTVSDDDPQRATTRVLSARGTVTERLIDQVTVQGTWELQRQDSQRSPSAPCFRFDQTIIGNGSFGLLVGGCGRRCGPKPEESEAGGAPQ